MILQNKILKKSYAVLGAGRSGIGIARLLNRKGIKVFLSDSEPTEKLKYLDIESLKNDNINFEIGKHTDEIFKYDVIIKSPGIPADNIVIQKALGYGKKIVSEIEAAFWFCPCPVIAITGTNGKTTTTELTGAIFRNAGFKTKVCGNVGLAFSEIIDELESNSVVVLEVSSFQLDSIDKFKPKVAIFLNFTPDHIEWHKSLEKYMFAKLKINANQDEGDLIIINYDDNNIIQQKKELKGNIAAFSIKENVYYNDIQAGSFLENEEIIYFDKIKNIKDNIINAGDIFIKGRHNVYNSLAAIIAAKAFGIDSEIIRNTLKEFPGVEHRIEFVRELNGISFYNDSKATNIDSLSVAIDSFEKNIVLIMGGKKMKNDFSKVRDSVKNRVKLIVAVGDSRYDVADYFSDFMKVEIANTFEDAVITSFRNSSGGDVVLFSPAYKSFDMFENFEHRGKEFKRIVNNLK